ncbi:hypothetical protein D3C76_1087480 [compost metagenome]
MCGIWDSHTAIPRHLLRIIVVIDHVAVCQCKLGAFWIGFLLQCNWNRLAVLTTCQLVDSNVINLHRFWKYGFASRITIKVTAYGQIHQQMELLIKRRWIHIIGRLPIADAVPVIFGRI